MTRPYSGLAKGESRRRIYRIGGLGERCLPFPFLQRGCHFVQRAAYLPLRVTLHTYGDAAAEILCSRTRNIR